MKKTDHDYIVGFLEDCSLELKKSKYGNIIARVQEYINKNNMSDIEQLEKLVDDCVYAAMQSDEMRLENKSIRVRKILLEYKI